MVDGEARLRVGPAGRTKALLHDLPLESRFGVAVRSVGAGDLVSEPAATADFDPAMLESIGQARQPPPPPPSRP